MPVASILRRQWTHSKSVDDVDLLLLFIIVILPLVVFVFDSPSPFTCGKVTSAVYGRIILWFICAFIAAMPVCFTLHVMGYV